MTAITSVRVVEGEARLFGEFDLIAKLGRGGMAEAFLAAKRARPAELVVVKRLTPDFADDVDHRAMLEEESRIMPLFSHPNVVRTVEVGEQEGQAYLAMEFLDGLPLDQCFDAVRALGQGAALHVVGELLDGLHYVHELRGADGASLEIVHRDVSPHNVFVTYEGRVTVVDFGIAKSRGRAKHTSTGVVRGKLAYMAPEQALCDEVDRRSDVFAAGVILWELLHGRRYWDGLGDVQILKRMTFGDLPKIDDSLPEPVRAVLARALATKPEERYPTAREMRAELVKLKSSTLSRKEIGAAVAEAAAGYRDALKAVVDAHLMSARGTGGLPGVDPAAVSVRAPAVEPAAVEGPSSSPVSSGPTTAPPPALGAVTAAAPSPLSTPAPALPFRAFTETGGASALDLPPRPKPRKRSGLSWGIAGIALLAAAVGVGIFVTRDRDRPGSATANAGAPPAATAEQGALVAFELEVSPPGARAYLDEMALPELPFSAKLERDGKAHAIRVEADGYLSEARIVVFDRDVKLNVALRAEPPELKASASASAAPATRASGRPRAPASAPAPPTPKSTSVADSKYPWGKKK